MGRGSVRIRSRARPPTFDKVSWGFKVIGDRPYLRDDGFRYTDAKEVYWDPENKVLIEKV